MNRAIDELLLECRVLGREFGAAQVRCSRIFEDQRQRIEALEAELIRARAAVIVQVTALWFASEPAVGEARSKRRAYRPRSGVDKSALSVPVR
ncbi:MAG: hypothetical protein ABWZ78_07470 [Burkholderiaceae bacterium]